jgi:hypothetical protein
MLHVAEMRPDACYACGVADVSHEDNPAAVGKRLETVTGRRLIDTHRLLAAQLHGAVRGVSRLLG